MLKRWRTAPRRWDSGSFLVLLTAGLFLTVVGGLYAQYLVRASEVQGEVVACRVEESAGLGRAPRLTTTLCDVRYTQNGRELTGTVEVRKSLPRGDLVAIQVLDDGDVEATGTSSRFALLLPLGLVLLVPPVMWGWPKR